MFILFFKIMYSGSVFLFLVGFFFEAASWGTAKVNGKERKFSLIIYPRTASLCISLPLHQPPSASAALIIRVIHCFITIFQWPGLILLVVSVHSMA